MWGREVVGSNHTIVPSGQAGYLCFALSKFELGTSVIGNVGNDYYGHMILERLKESKIDIRGVEIVENGQTCICIAICRYDGERAFVSNYASLSDFNSSIIYKHWELIESSAITCFVGTATFENFPLDQIKAIAGRVKSTKKSSVLDTGWYSNNFDEKTKNGIKNLLKEISIFLPNMDEAKAITGYDNPEDASLELQSYGVDIVVIKNGSKGSLVRSNNKMIHLPAISTKSLDSVGAGDVYNAGFLYGYVNKYNLETCMAFGSAAASFYISRSIDRFPTKQQMMDLAFSYYKDIR
jgi:sugar/nucleoside kinase (ribokinase family)